MATTVTMVSKSRTDYHCGRTNDSDETKKLGDCELFYHMEAFSWQENLCQIFSQRIQLKCFCLEKTSIW